MNDFYNIKKHLHPNYYEYSMIFQHPFTNEKEKITSRTALNYNLLHNSSVGTEYIDMLQGNIEYNIKRAYVHKHLDAYYEFVTFNDRHVNVLINIHNNPDSIKWELTHALFNIIKNNWFKETTVYISPNGIQLLKYYNILSYTEYEDIDKLYIARMTLNYKDYETYTDKSVDLNVVDAYYWNKDVNEDLIELILVPENDAQNTMSLRIKIEKDIK